MDTNFYLLLGGIALILFFVLLQRRAPVSAQPGDQYVPAALHAAIVAQNEQLRADQAVKEQELRDALAQLAERINK